MEAEMDTDVQETIFMCQNETIMLSQLSRYSPLPNAGRDVYFETKPGFFERTVGLDHALALAGEVGIGCDGRNRLCFTQKGAGVFGDTRSKLGRFVFATIAKLRQQVFGLGQFFGCEEKVYVVHGAEGWLGVIVSGKVYAFESNGVKIGGGASD
jgi:hypothetical protein